MRLAVFHAVFLRVTEKPLHVAHIQILDIFLGFLIVYVVLLTWPLNISTLID